jgi:hypothetical protein
MSTIYNLKSIRRKIKKKDGFSERAEKKWAPPAFSTNIWTKIQGRALFF